MDKLLEKEIKIWNRVLQVKYDVRLEIDTEEIDNKNVVFFQVGNLGKWFSLGVSYGKKEIVDFQKMCEKVIELIIWRVAEEGFKMRELRE